MEIERITYDKKQTDIGTIGPGFTLPMHIPLY